MMKPSPAGRNGSSSCATVNFNNMFLDYFKIAFYMIRSKPVRSALSLLGIYIGILALVVILAIHEGVRQDLDNLYRTSGAQIVLVFPAFNESSHKMGQLNVDLLNLLSNVNGVESAMLRTNREEQVKGP